MKKIVLHNSNEIAVNLATVRQGIIAKDSQGKFVGMVTISHDAYYLIPTMGDLKNYIPYETLRDLIETLSALTFYQL